jgi:hypothetical protein
VLADHLPVIKIVLSVGATSPFFQCAPIKSRKSPRFKGSPPQFALFARGLSHETFQPIQEGNEATWRELVSRSGVEDIYSNHGPSTVLDTVRRMTPCAQSDPGHWAAFFPLDHQEADESVDNKPGSDSDEWE